ncbi:MAG: hypothetical protein OXC91_06590 [Rhodobacteraceae bacterium]|nr:hypothetical protein [Paracoccaceae bacterium]
MDGPPGPAGDPASAPAYDDSEVRQEIDGSYAVQKDTQANLETLDPSDGDWENADEIVLVAYPATADTPSHSDFVPGDGHSTSKGAGNSIWIAIPDGITIDRIRMFNPPNTILPESVDPTSKWTVQDSVAGANPHYSYYRLTNLNGSTNTIAESLPVVRPQIRRKNYLNRPFVRHLVTINLGSLGVAPPAGYNLGVLAPNNNNHLLIETKVGGGQNYRSAWVLSKDLYDSTRRGNALILGANVGAFYRRVPGQGQEQAAWANNIYLVPTGPSSTNHVRITEYDLGYIPPTGGVEFFTSSGGLTIPQDELVHFGGLRSNRGLSQIRFDRDDIETMDWLRFQYFMQKFTVSGIPSDEMQRLYFAVAEDPKTHREIYMGPGESRPISHLFRRAERTINSIRYVVWFMDAENAVGDGWNGQIVHAGGDQ